MFYTAIVAWLGNTYFTNELHRAKAESVKNGTMKEIDKIKLANTFWTIKTVTSEYDEPPPKKIISTSTDHSRIDKFFGL